MRKKIILCFALLLTTILFSACSPSKVEEKKAVVDKKMSETKKAVESKNEFGTKKLVEIKKTITPKKRTGGS